MILDFLLADVRGQMCRKFLVCTEFVIPSLQQLVNHVFDCAVSVNLFRFRAYIVYGKIGAIGITVKA